MALFQKKISSVKVPHHKNTAEMQSVIAPPPAEVLIPTNMHSGDAAVPIVQPGDHVFLGQLIAKEEGKNSSPEYFEQINVLGITFVYTPEGYPKGLCRAKALYYVTTAGGCYVPVSNRTPRNNMAEICENVRPSLVVTNGAKANGFPCLGKAGCCPEKSHKNSSD